MSGARPRRNPEVERLEMLVASLQRQLDAAVRMQCERVVVFGPK